MRTVLGRDIECHFIEDKYCTLFQELSIAIKFLLRGGTLCLYVCFHSGISLDLKLYRSCMYYHSLWAASFLIASFLIASLCYFWLLEDFIIYMYLVQTKFTFSLFCFMLSKLSFSHFWCFPLEKAAQFS